MIGDQDFTETMRTRLQGDLRSAMKRRDVLEVSTLRCLIAALDNAGAVATLPDAAEDQTRWSCGSQYVATSSGGGPTEVARRALTPGGVFEILNRERSDRETAVVTLESLGRAADRERAEISVIERYLA